MGLAFRLMLFMLFLNIAVGIFSWIGGASWVPIGMSYGGNEAGALYNQLNNTVTSPLDPSNNLLFRIVDIISLGAYNKVKDFLQVTIFGLPSMLVGVGIIPLGMAVFVANIMTVLYIIGIIELFTGKDLGLR